MLAEEERVGEDEVVFRFNFVEVVEMELADEAGEFLKAKVLGDDFGL